MARTPYAAGDLVLITNGERTRIAVVSSYVETTSLDDGRRWRLLCRWADDPESIVDELVYCDSDGIGDKVRPADELARERPRVRVRKSV